MLSLSICFRHAWIVTGLPTRASPKSRPGCMFSAEEGIEPHLLAVLFLPLGRVPGNGGTKKQKISSSTAHNIRKREIRAELWAV